MRWQQRHALEEAPHRPPAKRLVRISQHQATWLQGHHEASLLDVRSESNTSHDSADATHKLPYAVQGLSSLNSEYVGPVGVGLKAVPAGCSSGAGDARLSTLIDENAAAKTGVCQMVSDSLFVVLDTGSTNIWLASDLCESPMPCAAEERKRYEHKKS